MARIEREMSQEDLAIRVNISRQTVAKIEKGDSNVSIGAAFEAAYIVGIPVFAEGQRNLSALREAVLGISSILPKRAYKQDRYSDEDDE